MPRGRIGGSGVETAAVGLTAGCQQSIGVDDRLCGEEVHPLPGLPGLRCNSHTSSKAVRRWRASSVYSGRPVPLHPGQHGGLFAECPPGVRAMRWMEKSGPLPGQRRRHISLDLGTIIGLVGDGSVAAGSLRATAVSAVRIEKGRGSGESIRLTHPRTQRPDCGRPLLREPLPEGWPAQPGRPTGTTLSKEKRAEECFQCGSVRFVGGRGRGTGREVFGPRYWAQESVPRRKMDRSRW